MLPHWLFFNHLFLLLWSLPWYPPDWCPWRDSTIQVIVVPKKFFPKRNWIFLAFFPWIFLFFTPEASSVLRSETFSKKTPRKSSCLLEEVPLGHQTEGHHQKPSFPPLLKIGPTVAPLQSPLPLSESPKVYQSEMAQDFPGTPRVPNTLALEAF